MAYASALSLIVCSFNPKPVVLGRCLAALEKLLDPSPAGLEVTIVDNASEPSLGSQAYVRQFLQQRASRRLLVEARAGLTNARLAGARASTGAVLVFVDDDNLLRPDYLVRTCELINNHPSVGVWGPGTVDVEWEAGTSRWIRGYAACFQERRVPVTRFDAVAGWPDFYPTGTGMIVRREVLDEYARQVAAGHITATDRTGTQLTSAGDAQIIWTAVRMGLSAGTSPELRLTHFVEQRKANVSYILRMIFAAMASGRIALRQSFPDRPELWTPPSSLQAQGRIVATVLKELFLLHLRSGPVQVVRQMGDLHGLFLAARQPPPWITRVAARWLGFSWDDP